MNLIVDANNLAYRANVTSDLYTNRGERVSGIFGSLQMLQSYLRQPERRTKNRLLELLQEQTGVESQFKRAVMCWDYGKSERRMNLYPGYKGQRQVKRDLQSEEDKAAFNQFVDQMNQLHQILPKFAIKSLKIRGWEGDDLVYACSKLLGDEICVIVSTDKDMLQLVSDKVFVYSPFKDVLVTPNNFYQVVGVSKAAYMSYRVLVGDSSDNIGGVEGIGDKTAKDLLIKFKTLGGILLNREQVMKSKRTSKIFDNLSLLDRNERLMNFIYVDLSEVEDEIKNILEDNLTFSDKEVKMFLASKQFNSIMSDFIDWSDCFKKLS